MGKLSRFNLNEFIEKYGVSTLIETGSGYGTGINYAREFKKLKRIFSCEIIDEQAKKLQKEIQEHDNRVLIYSGKSCDYLNFILNQEVVKNETSCVYFLDSHFPGADLGISKFDDEKNKLIRLPLETELDIIYRLRNPDIYRDIFIIDDLRIYKKLPIHGGDLEKLNLGNVTDYSNDFFSRWKKTHDLEEILEHEGYLKMTPKEIYV